MSRYSVIHQTDNERNFALVLNRLVGESIQRNFALSYIPKHLVIWLRFSRFFSFGDAGTANLWLMDFKSINLPILYTFGIGALISFTLKM